MSVGAYSSHAWCELLYCVSFCDRRTSMCKASLVILHLVQDSPAWKDTRAHGREQTLWCMSSTHKLQRASRRPRSPSVWEGIEAAVIEDSTIAARTTHPHKKTHAKPTRTPHMPPTRTEHMPHTRTARMPHTRTAHMPHTRPLNPSSRTTHPLNPSSLTETGCKTFTQHPSWATLSR